MAIQPTAPTPLASALAERMAGGVIAPDHPEYETARRIWNGMIDKRPVAIARCADAGDVATAVRFAAEHGLPLAVRGGGHNVAGTAVVDDGLVIDLSAMRGVRIDAAAPHGARAGRRDVGRRRPRDRPARARHSGRGRVRDRRGRPGAERWRLSSAPARRDDRRQPGLGRGGARRRPPRARKRRRAPRPALGAARRWRQLRRRDVVRAAPARSSGPRCSDSTSPTRSRTPGACWPAGAMPSPVRRTSSRPRGSSGRCP